MELFLDQLPETDELLKEAAFAARLSETPENWPQELNSELFKQLPFLSDYDVNVNLDRVDTQRGFAFGYADVANKTERPELEHEESGLPHIRIPLIIKEKLAKPFSVFLDGERVMPLTEERIRECLFNPSTFDLSATPPRDPSLVETLMPPQRQGIGMGGEYKMASAEEAFMKKLGWADEAQSPATSGGIEGWLKQFHGTPLMERALEVEKKKLHHDIEENQQRQTEDAKRNKQIKSQGAMWRRRDAITNERRGLELELALHRHSQLVEKTKTSSGEELKNEAGSPKMEGWCAQFSGTPLMERAMELEKRNLENDIERNRMDQAQDAKRQRESKARDKIYREGDSIRTAKRGLELELELQKHHAMLGEGHEKTSAILDLEKVAFSHISKPQWEAIYKSDGVRKAIQKWGGPGHPQVTNKVYETAAKAYGYHPKVLDFNPVKAAEQAKKAAQKATSKGGAAGGAAKPKTASLLRAIAPTIRESDAERFTERVASDPTLIAGFRKAGAAELLVEVFEKTKRASSSERLMALAEAVEPTCVTIQKLPGGNFLVKSANVNAFVEKTAAGEQMPHEEAAAAMGPENAQAMQPGQTASVVSDPVEEEEIEEAPPTKAKVIEEFGQYKVQDVMGNSLLGHVFPTTLSWDGEFSPQPIALFTNGSAYALQEQIAGELVGKGVTLPSDSPRGEGVFYAVQDGEAICTMPVTIASSMAGPDGLAKLTGMDAFGNPIQASFTEGLSQPARISDVEYAFPSTWKFMRLNGQTQLVPDPMQMNKQAQVDASRDAVTLFYNGSYNFEGACGLEKISRDLRYDLDPVSAEFLLGVLGVDGITAKTKVAEARKKGHVKLANLKTIRLLGERFKEAEKTAHVLLMKMPNLRRDLIKEAAAMEDEDTVDSLLALNFINPENLATFVGYQPELEGTSEKLAEMLLYSYLGEKSLPEGALDRSMKNLEEVIVGLKAIAHSEG
jgi:hypothetical protein